MNKECGAVFFGKDKDTEFRVLDEEGRLIVFAVSGGEIVGSIRIGSKSYFYSLFGKKIFECFIQLPGIDLNEVEGPWQEKIFQGENGLVMLFDKGQFLLKITEEIQNNIITCLQKTYKGKKELVLND